MVAILIPLMKARRIKTPMEVADRVMVLRLHGEYVWRLTTELTTALTALEHALREQSGNPRAGARGSIQRPAETQRLLGAETESFGQRLTHFLRVTAAPPVSENHTGLKSLRRKDPRWEKRLVSKAGVVALTAPATTAFFTPFLLRFSG